MLFVLFSHLLAGGKADSGSEHRKAGDAGARAVSGGGGGAWMLASHRSGRPPQGRHPEQTLDPRKQPKHGFLVPGAVAAGGGGPFLEGGVRNQEANLLRSLLSAALPRQTMQACRGVSPAPRREVSRNHE